MIAKLIFFLLLNQPEVISFQKILIQLPLTFDFYKAPNLFAYTTNKKFLKIRLDKKKISIVDSGDIYGVSGNVYYGAYTDDGIYLFSTQGIYFGGIKSFEKVCDESSVVYSDTYDGRLYALGRRHFYILLKGRISKRFNLLGNTGAYFAVKDGRYAIIGGNGELFRLDLTSGDIKILDSLTHRKIYNYYEIRSRFDFWHLRYHPFINSSRYSIYYVGDSFTEVTNKGYYVIVDSSVHVIKKITLTVTPLKMFKYRGFLIIVGKDFAFMADNMYMPSTWIFVLDTSNFDVVDSFSYAYTPLSVNIISNEYWVLSNSFGLLYLFKDLNFNRFINRMTLANGLMLVSGALKIDYDGDSDSDLVFIGLSNAAIKKEERVHSILILKNNISEAQNFALDMLRLAREKKNLIEAPRALNYVDMARSIFSVILPESLDTANRLRARIYPLYRANIFITKTYKYSILVVLFAIIAILYFRLQSLKDKVKPPPPGKFLEKMFAYPLFHKYTVRVAPMLESSFTQQFVEEVQKDSKDLHDYLVMPEVSNAFQNSNKFWKRLYRALKKNLRDIELLANIYFKRKRLRKLAEILLRRNLKSIGKLREQFGQGLKESRGDIVIKALLPAIEEVKKKYPKVNFETQLNGSFSFNFYEDELKEFKRIFHAILENAAESFEYYTLQEPPRVKITVTDDELELTIKIEDNGRGMSPDVLDKIFIPGFSYKKHKEGGGYGLTGVKSFIEKYGEIYVDSEVGKGTTFIIKIELK